MVPSLPPPRKLVISGDCVSVGLAACLGRLLPDCEILVFPIISLRNEGEEERMRAALDDADVWAGRFGLGFDPSSTRDDLRVLRIPPVVFSAFHPDLVYAKRRCDGRHVNSTEDYNSSIILWAWQQGLDEQATARLFTAEIFRALGFLDAWTPSVQAMKSRFEESDLDWWPFFLHAKRLGCFMYSLNHPKLPVIMHLAAQIARKLTNTPSLPEMPATDCMEDVLDHSIWPVYPPIAEAYALAGGYAWKTMGKTYPHLASYIRHCFENYQAEKLDPEDIEFLDPCGERFFRVLNAAMRRRP